MKKYFFMVTAALALTIQTISQTIINAGPVSGTWTASGSPYHIMGNIEVPTGSTLIIEPGVTVKIYTNLSFTVYGQLLASGNESDSILFVPVSNYWRGLQLLSATDTCKFNYCSFKNFLNGTPNSGGYIKGGVIYTTNSNILIGNCLFINNQIIATGFYLTCYGGAICLENSHGLILNSSFINNGITMNSSVWDLNACGGAIYAVGNTIISQNIIRDNAIDIINAGDCSVFSYGKGGGIYIQGNNDLVENNLIQNNSCITKAIGAGISWTCWGEGHAESFGGGVYGGVIKNNIIINNFCKATGIGYPAPDFWGDGHSICKGGGVYGASVINNNLIMNNTCLAIAEDEDGGIATSTGGGIEEGGFAQNNTIINNQVQANAGYGGTIEVNGAGVYSGILKNCIIYDNIGAAQVSDAIITYSCVQGGYSGQGNISSNPLFISGPQGNYYLKQFPCQGQLSPCVDAGDPNTPLFAGTTRTDEIPDLGIIDMGFHYELTNLMVIADFNSDINCGVTPMVVNFFDNSYQYQIDSIKYEWDFENDGIIDSYEVNPAWTYDEIGLFSVKHKITGYSNDTVITDSIIKENFIMAPDEFIVFGGYTYNKSYGEYPLIVNFIDTSFISPCGEIDQWQWDFQNDGIFDSYVQNPVWIYSLPGIYSVKLIAGNSDYMVYDTLLKQDLITVCHLIPGFYAEPLSGTNLSEVHFYDSCITINTQIAIWKWDFQHDFIIDSYDQNPIWTYTEPGIYSVELIITDTSGLYSQFIVKEDYIEILPVGTAKINSIKDFNLNIYPNPFTNDLIIEFEFDKPEEVTVQIFDVAFNSVATIAKDEKVSVGVKNWKWASPHYYTQSGIYYISLSTLSGKKFAKKCIMVE